MITELRLKIAQDAMRQRLRPGYWERPGNKWKQLRLEYAKFIESHEIHHLTPETLKSLCGPLVYVWLRKGILEYIGSSHSICRCFDKQHHRRALFQQCDEILIFPCATRKDAYTLEQRLIQVWQPRSQRWKQRRKPSKLRLAMLALKRLEKRQGKVG